MKWLTYFDKIALVCGQRKIHYTQMMQTIIGTGNALKAAIPERCHVAIIGANSPEWVMAMYSIWYAGATVVPIDFMSTPEEIAYILDDCTPAIVFCDATTEAKLQTASKLMKTQMGPVKRLEKIGEHISSEPIPKDTSFETSNEELAFIIYTSGTTGKP